MTIFENINKYVKLLPESMQYDSREAMLTIFDRFMKDAEDLKRIEKYANHPGKNSSLAELEQALYELESPYYRYCASGGGSDPSQSQVWQFERNRLSALVSIKQGNIPQVPISFRAKIRNIISKVSWLK